MGQHLLRFESPRKVIGLTEPSEPHEVDVGQLRVVEHFQPHPDQRRREQGLGEYFISVERPVEHQGELTNALMEADKFAAELEVAWCYTWGVPFTALRTMLVEMDAPRGWSGNLSNIQKRMIVEESGITYDSIGFESRQSEWRSELPLKSTLTVRASTVAASPIVRELIELHIHSHQVNDGRLFTLAKALEIVGAFFQQTKRARAARNNGVEQEMLRIGVRNEMTQSVEWLFDIANERFDVRHAWDAGAPGVALHPRLSNQERLDFVKNADLVIQAFICSRLGINVPHLTLNTNRPTSRGRWNGDVLEFDSASTERAS